MLYGGEHITTKNYNNPPHLWFFMIYVICHDVCGDDAISLFSIKKRDHCLLLVVVFFFILYATFFIVCVVSHQSEQRPWECSLLYLGIFGSIRRL